MRMNPIAGATLLAAVAALSFSPAQAELTLGADVLNRYVWRGADFGNAASIQPGVSYAAGGLEIGAWSAWSLTGAANGNENDLYVSASVGPVGLTLTDYFFPAFAGNDSFFDFDRDGGSHTLEISATYGAGPMSLLGALNFWGDSDDSFYAEAGYDLGSVDGVGVSLAAGLGNGDYTTDTDPMVVHLAIRLTRDRYSASYIVNPEAETSFLVFGRSI